MVLSKSFGIRVFPLYSCYEEGLPSVKEELSTYIITK